MVTSVVMGVKTSILLNLINWRQKGWYLLIFSFLGDFLILFDSFYTHWISIFVIRMLFTACQVFIFHFQFDFETLDRTVVQVACNTFSFLLALWDYFIGRRAHFQAFVEYLKDCQKRFSRVYTFWRGPGSDSIVWKLHLTSVHRHLHYTMCWRSISYSTSTVVESIC